MAFDPILMAQRRLKEKILNCPADGYSKDDLVLAWGRIVSSPIHLIALDDLAAELGLHVVEALVRSNAVALHPVTHGWEVLDRYGIPENVLISAGSVPNLLAIQKILGDIRRAPPKTAEKPTCETPRS